MSSASEPTLVEIDHLAKSIYKIYPVTVEGVDLEWDHIELSHQERANIYRDVAHRLIVALQSGTSTKGIISPA